MNSRFLAVISSLPLLLAPLPAVAQTGVGVGLRVAEAQSDFADEVSGRGWGVVGQSMVTGEDVWVSLGTGWTRFSVAPDSAADGAEDSGDDVDVYELLLGWGVSVGPLRIGVKGGRTFGYERQWTYMPVVGIGGGPLAIMAEWDHRGPVKWLGVTASLVR